MLLISACNWCYRVSHTTGPPSSFQLAPPTWQWLLLSARVAWIVSFLCGWVAHTQGAYIPRAAPSETHSCLPSTLPRRSLPDKSVSFRPQTCTRHHCATCILAMWKQHADVVSLPGTKRAFQTGRQTNTQGGALVEPYLQALVKIWHAMAKFWHARFSLGSSPKIDHFWGIMKSSWHVLKFLKSFDSFEQIRQKPTGIWSTFEKNETPSYTTGPFCLFWKIRVKHRSKVI